MNISPERAHDERPVSRRGFCRAGLASSALYALPLLTRIGRAQQPGPVGDDGTATAADSEGTGTTAQKGDAGQPKTDGDSGQKPDKPKVLQLFDPETFPRTWRYFTAEKDNPLQNTWQVARDKDSDAPYLRCLGKPYGFIRTIEQYSNFEFGLQWRFPTDPNGNSGVLLYTVEPDRIWPNAIQLQLHRPKAGSVFPIGEARADNRLDIKEKDLSRPLNVWNECTVTCMDGRITVVINERKVGEVTGCSPHKGAIALQSEGSEIHFQKIWLKKLS